LKECGLFLFGNIFYLPEVEAAVLRCDPRALV
jgi:hypothetical protein